MKLQRSSLEFVRNSPQYYDFIRKLRTAPGVIRGFLSQHKITTEQQRLYMKEHEKDYFICLHDGKPIGFIGVVAEDLRLAVAVPYQRMGIASFMLEKLREVVPRFNVRVRQDNIASLSFFERNGFMKSGVDTDGCVLMTRRSS